jgi:hypothetical protein
MEPAMLRRLLIAALILTAAPSLATVFPNYDKKCEAGFASSLPLIVRKSAIEAVDETYDVNLYGFCKGFEFHDTGNAGGLTRTIAANPYLADPIEDLGWSVDDVKFVRVGDRSIDLWLHRDP